MENKWSEEEWQAAEKLIREPAWGVRSISSIAIELACERNMLRSALQNLAYMTAQISPPPYGHKCRWCGECTQRAKDEAREALSRSEVQK